MKQPGQPRNNGVFAEKIYEYVKYKRALGYKMEDVEERLSRFDKLATERGESGNGIGRELAEEWCKPLPMESPYNRYGRISILRGFSAYLQMMGFQSYVPKLPKPAGTFCPHIFTRTEMANIFRECDKLHLHRRYTRSLKIIMPCLIRLLYGTGIRIGEAMRLKHSDVNLSDGLLLLRECKNGRDRVVPMSLSVREVCKDYVAFKQRIGAGTDPEDTFFTSAEGNPGSPSTVYELFRAVMYRAGIPHGGRGKGPRLHDLRHTFCVNALVRLSESGLDLYYSLPVLMTYMGHRSVEATNRYVRLTEEMYPNLIGKVDEAYRYVFPNLGMDMEEGGGYETD